MLPVSPDEPNTLLLGASHVMAGASAGSAPSAPEGAAAVAPTPPAAIESGGPAVGIEPVSMGGSSASAMPTEGRSVVARGAGRGAAQVVLPPGRHVYGAWSRRAGGASLGVDLTPDGACSIACVYCQVPRQSAARGRSVVDMGLLQAELERALSLPPESGWADIALAGSGEPTLAANLESAIDTIVTTLDRAQFNQPRRVYTNGLHLAHPEVVCALERWLENGDGQVWVKLDALEDRTIERVWQVRLSSRTHLSKLFKFAEGHPIGIQSTLVRAHDLPSIEETARRMSVELAEALQAGARVTAIHLLSPSRKPGNEAAAQGIIPASATELEAAAAILRAVTSVPVAIYL